MAAHPRCHPTPSIDTQPSSVKTLSSFDCFVNRLQRCSLLPHEQSAACSWGAFFSSFSATSSRSSSSVLQQNTMRNDFVTTGKLCAMGSYRVRSPFLHNTVGSSTTLPLYHPKKTGIEQMARVVTEGCHQYFFDKEKNRKARAQPKAHALKEINQHGFTFHRPAT